MRHPLRILLCNLLFVIIILSTVGLFNFILDPCMDFRSHGNPVIHEYRIRSIYNKACHGSFETAVIGSSTSLRISESDVNEIFGGGARNLTINGTSSYISHAIMKHAIDKQNIKRIIYGHDFFIYNYTIKKVVNNYQSDASAYDKIKYLLDFKLAIIQIGKYIITQIKAERYNSKKKKNESSPQSSNTNNRFFFSHWQVIKHTPTNMQRNMDNVKLLAKLIEDNPQVHYHIYFTPYHILWWYQISKLNELDTYFKIKRETIKRISVLKNVSLYDFQNIDEIIFDMPSFLDSIHCNPNINAKVLNFIKENKYRVSSDEHSHLFENCIRQKIKRFEKANAKDIKQYKVNEDLERIKKHVDLKRKRAIHQ